MHLADRVRDHCRQVCETATLITINLDELADYALELATPQSFESSDVPKDGPTLEAARVLVLALDCINFGSGWHDVISKRPGHSGARSMAAALREYESASGPLSAATLEMFDAAKCAQVFGQDGANQPAMELMVLFSRALQELAHFLDRHGSAAAAIDSVDRSAIGFAQLLTEMGMFGDLGYYKRAQITPADLARESLATFDDLDELTAFADNLVPHVMWVDGLIALDPDLEASIAAGQLLLPGGTAERELRAAAVHVVELLAKHRTDLTPMGIDQSLWERGGGPRYKGRPRPRCRNFYY
jgi:hypothetical protein